MKLRTGQFGLRRQSEAATPLFAWLRSFRRRRGSRIRRIPAALQNRGFTLIELILILALLVIITSLAAPAMANFIRGRALDSEARRFFALTHEAQSRAVSEGVPIVIWVDQKNDAYGISEEMAGKPGTKTSDPKAETLPVDSSLQIAVLNLGLGTPTTFNNLPAIRFLPDGTVDVNSPQTVELVDSAGSMRWLLLNRMRTGYEISDSKPN
jgi:type II secretion system protein H